MNNFKYSIHLNEINKISTKVQLLKLMAKFSNWDRLLIKTSAFGIFIKFPARSKEDQIKGVLLYSLFSKARERYLSLGYPLGNLPNYAQHPTISINLDETLKTIEDTHHVYNTTNS